MRQYEPIWQKLKSLPFHEAKTFGVSVTANRRLHPRIVKAVTKEKWLDLPYKLKLDPHKTIMYHVSKGSILTFYLELSQTAILKSITSENV